jgi:hypothetical protein
VSTPQKEIKVNTIQDELTLDQRNEALKRFDEMAEGITTAATGLGGLNGLGLWAAQIKTESLLNAVIYTLPILLLGIALLYALWVKYPQWDMHLEAYKALLTQKQKRYHVALLFLALGILMLFIALLVYTARAVQSLV